MPTQTSQSAPSGNPVVIRNGQIAELVLNAPDRKNALPLAAWQAIPGLLAELARDPDLRVCIVRGAGGKSFCAGGVGSDEKRVHELVAALTVVNCQQLHVLGRHDPHDPAHEKIAFVAYPIRPRGHEVLRVPEEDAVSHVSREPLRLLSVLRDAWEVLHTSSDGYRNEASREMLAELRVRASFCGPPPRHAKAIRVHGDGPKDLGEPGVHPRSPRADLDPQVDCLARRPVVDARDRDYLDLLHDIPRADEFRPSIVAEGAHVKRGVAGPSA